MNNQITNTDSNPLLRLLQVFDAESLGEGDLVEGINVLAGKCISLANLHPSASCLITPDGNRLPVGMSFASVGGLTESLVNEKVLDPIARIQNNLGDHLASDVANEAAKLASMPEQERLRNRPTPPAYSSALADINMAINGVSLARDSFAFRQLLVPCRDQGPGELVKTPAVFLHADSPSGLEKQLCQAHRRYPYVRAVLAGNPSSERLESILLSVVRGTSLPTEATGPIHIRGHVAVCCTQAKLTHSIGAGDESLLSKMLWLVDGDSHSLLSKQGDGIFPAPYKTQHNYIEALQAAWAERLDYRQNKTTSIQYDWEPRQREWLKFLKSVESRCPGVTFAARPLFGTLIFGLLKLSVGQKGEKPRWTDADALALAKFLVGRMVQFRERLVQAELDARVLKLAIKIVPKLEGGPLNAGSIVRKTNRLLVGDCREVLEFLGRLGVARCVGEGNWELAVPAAQAMKEIRRPFIDV